LAEQDALGAIVGREPELAAVERLLDAIPVLPASLVIEGEPGIGKTTIWRAAVRAAGERSFRVLQARPAEAEADLSYVALADLVADAFEETRDALPGPQERALGAALLRVDPDEPADSRTTDTALVGVLAALASDRPVLVAIDDVQWLDRASARALTFAARRLPAQVGLVLARRGEGSEDHPLGLGRALPDGCVDRLVLGPLSLAALHHLIEGQLGKPLPRVLLTRVAESSGGNPFFALEFARALDARPRSHPSDEPLPVPPDLSRLVGARIEALSPVAREAVLVVASLSQPTEALVMEALGSGDDVRHALGEAEEAGVLVFEGRRVRFAHPLLESAVYGSASTQRRRQLHARLAEVVPDIEERARHRAQAALEQDEATAIEIELAAQAAARRGAHEAAGELFRASQRLTPPGRPEEFSRRVLGEASALAAAGDFATACKRAEHAAGVARASTQRAQALALLGRFTWVRGNGRAAVRYLEEALAAAEEDVELRTRISASLVVVCGIVDQARAVEVADAIIPVLTDERALAEVLVHRFHSGALRGLGARLDLLERSLALEEKALSHTLTGPSQVPIVWFQTIDDFERVRARFTADDAWFSDRGFDDVRRANHRSQLAWAELRAGNCDLAQREIEMSCSLLPEYDARGNFALPFVWRALIDAHFGRIDRARATVRPLIAEYELTGEHWWTIPALTAAAFVEFAAGDHQAVDAALERLHALRKDMGLEELLLDRSEPFHIESLVALGELDRAKNVLQYLEWRGRTIPRLWITATLPRARALVLAAEGDVSGALAALDELDVSAAARLPFELAWALLVRGQLLRRAKQRRAAADALAEAEATFERLGARPWSQRARAELDRVGLRRAPSDLTATERRVAELAASGMTNREVARAAFMSPKTVDANLARVYRKLGIRSRAELGARIGHQQRDVGVQT
jgi:DNA-binding CsgD family transcriptional regulator